MLGGDYPPPAAPLMPPSAAVWVGGGRGGSRSSATAGSRLSFGRALAAAVVIVTFLVFANVFSSASIDNDDDVLP